MTTSLLTSETILDRPFGDEDDFWKVHHLLTETFPLVPPGWNWETRRWEGWHADRASPLWSRRCELIHLWETADGRLVGAAHPEDGGDGWLELHPDYRARLEAIMLDWAEDHLRAPDETGQSRLDTFVQDYDLPRRRLLERRGYQKMPWSGMTYQMRLGPQPLPDAPLTEGYRLRSLHADGSDHQRMADVLNAGFGRTVHTAEEYRLFSTLAPSFRPELHLVAELPDGSFAAHVGVTYDPANRRGIFEPVCTHSDYRRKGLARSLMVEGLHRLKALGADCAFVGTGDAVPANALYEAVGFTEAYQGWVWRKRF